MLSIIKNKEILRLLDGKRYRNGDIFKIVEEELKKRGFQKTVLQIRTKFKTLKAAYYKVKRHNNTSGADKLTCPFYEELDELLHVRPMCSLQNGVDTTEG